MRKQGSFAPPKLLGKGIMAKCHAGSASNEKNPGCFGYFWGMKYYPPSYNGGLFHEPLKGSLLNNQYFIGIVTGQRFWSAARFDREFSVWNFGWGPGCVNSWTAHLPKKSAKYEGFTWQFREFVTLFGMVSSQRDPKSKAKLSDLQRTGTKRSRLESPGTANTQQNNNQKTNNASPPKKKPPRRHDENGNPQLKSDKYPSGKISLSSRKKMKLSGW